MDDKRRKRLYRVLNIFFILLLVASYIFVMGGVQPVEDETKKNATQSCGFDYPKPPEVNFDRSWSSEDGHTYQIDIDNMNEGYHLVIEKNGEKIETVHNDTELTYQPDGGDSFTVTQFSEYHVSDFELQSISINNYS